MQTLVPDVAPKMPFGQVTSEHVRKYFAGLPPIAQEEPEDATKHVSLQLIPPQRRSSWRVCLFPALESCWESGRRRDAIAPLWGVDGRERAHPGL